MSQNAIQSAFHSGEWAPALNARVDLAKYHSAAALVRNFFVDYRGGVSSRTGTKYILRTYKSSTVRLIPFQASFTVGYILEFGDGYIRFFYQGAPILEPAKTITSAAVGPPEVFTSAGHGYSNNDWIFVSNKYYIIQNATTNTFTLTDLFGNAITTNPFTLPISAQRVYTIASPYAAADLALVKFAQNVNTLILCHPNYPPQILTLISAANWTIAAITFGSTAVAPTSLAESVTGGSGMTTYAYVVTSVDESGNESGPSTRLTFTDADITQAVGTVSLSWTASANAIAYNVYKAQLSYSGTSPAGIALGYIGNTTSTDFIDSAEIAPDFSQTPPIAQSPFSGTSVSSITITAGGNYTSIPLITIDPPISGTTAQAQAVMGLLGVTIAFGGSPGPTGYRVGDIIGLPGGIVLQVTGVDTHHVVTSISIINLGGQTTVIPSNPVAQSSSSGPGVGATFNLTWQVVSAIINNPGNGYGGAPGITFSPAGATATSTLTGGGGTSAGLTFNGNPGVPSYYQQRLVLGAPSGALQTFYMSQPGLPFNFNISDPIQDDDAIQASLVSSQLNDIKSLVPVQSGLLAFTSKIIWLINGGSPGAPVTPANINANANSYIGASDVPPIVINFDVLYVQSKGSYVRDVSYNFYTNVFTGTDISTLSSHLFYGFTLNQWAWAEEPFKVVWGVRNDGILLSLTFLKEQELIGWAHHDTQGLFQSVATVTEQIPQGSVDAIYFVVQRVIEGETIQYIERLADRYLSTPSSAWCVDSGLQYNGAAATSFSGGEHLGGLTVTGLADGIVIPSFVMPVNGNFTLAIAASVVTVGLSFLPQLQTLPLDLGEPTIQGKRKKISAVTVRVEDTLGLQIGQTFNTLVNMKDLIIGNINVAANSIVTGLVTGDARTLIDPSWTEPGQYCIQQPLPLPATILGVIPEIVVGDTAK